jgi:2-methylfumaryl-CoA isomerase
MSVTTAVLAALRRRDRTGAGGRIDIALADVALAGVANLGWLSEAASGVVREPIGNAIYGSYGQEFLTRNDRYVVVVALTPKQWTALVSVAGAEDAISALESARGVDLRQDESARYRLRAEIGALLAPWFRANDSATVAAELTAARVLWAPYRTFAEAAASLEGPLRTTDQPGIGQVVSAESAMRWDDYDDEPMSASALGADSRDVLIRLGAMTDEEVDGLVRDGVVHEATEAEVST